MPLHNPACPPCYTRRMQSCSSVERHIQVHTFAPGCTAPLHSPPWLPEGTAPPSFCTLHYLPALQLSPRPPEAPLQPWQAPPQSAEPPRTQARLWPWLLFLHPNARPPCYATTAPSRCLAERLVLLRTSFQGCTAPLHPRVRPLCGNAPQLSFRLF